MGTTLGLFIDLERCHGCNTCMIACKVENQRESGSGIRIETKGGPHPNTPGGRFPRLYMHYLPIPCMHCEEPPCLEACPVGAISRREDGIVLVDEEMCDGCRACLPACPFDALDYSSESGTVWKCNLCSHRVDRGLEPFCVICCEAEAMHFGDLDDATSEIAQLIEARTAHPVKPEFGVRRAVHYGAPMGYSLEKSQ